MSYLSNLALNNEIQELVAKSKPIPVKELPLTKIECDLSIGNFDFYFKNQNNIENCINLTFYAYWLQVYPKNGPIEYYYNDENDKNVNYYDGNGYIDGALDNDYYYEIDEKWHAIMLQHLTRHSRFWNGGQTEREVDEWMKNDVEKFEKQKL